MDKDPLNPGIDLLIIQFRKEGTVGGNLAPDTSALSSPIVIVVGRGG
jgi:hypothetical protein